MIRPIPFSENPTVPHEGSESRSLVETPNFPSNSNSDGCNSAPVTSGPASTIGEYDCSEIIARGGMGIVYRARHRATGDEVAVKTLRLDLMGSSEVLQRF